MRPSACETFPERLRSHYVPRHIPIKTNVEQSISAGDSDQRLPLTTLELVTNLDTMPPPVGRDNGHDTGGRALFLIDIYVLFAAVV